ncbi:MAG: hypothetical protein AVDCRST_MAG86-453 [uncultured Truepera sp.]|uniref:Lipoprotein n=1 Tax=uncultured Truepera sp. TaxID=543023 RepID=A0A6J4URS7_9DEIN|nr:MAG: hypothetical protein AVDCRST_MAG86-453 [uncultured Truepera sp.]
MRRSGLLLLVCGAALLAGCAKEPVAAEDEQISPPAPNPYLRSLDIALGEWQQLAAENGDSYRYVVNAGSVLGGPGYNTTLTVQEGEVVQRDLEITEIDDAGNVTVVESWSETGAAVGSHAEGAEPITIDGRFETCKQEVDKPDINAYDVDLS